MVNQHEPTLCESTKGKRLMAFVLRAKRRLGSHEYVSYTKPRTGLRSFYRHKLSREREKYLRFLLNGFHETKRKTERLRRCINCCLRRLFFVSTCREIKAHVFYYYRYKRNWYTNYEMAFARYTRGLIFTVMDLFFCYSCLRQRKLWEDKTTG